MLRVEEPGKAQVEHGGRAVGEEERDEQEGGRGALLSLRATCSRRQSEEIGFWKCQIETPFIICNVSGPRAAKPPVGFRQGVPDWDVNLGVDDTAACEALS